MHQDHEGHKKLTKCSCHRPNKPHRSVDRRLTTKRVEMLEKRMQLYKTDPVAFSEKYL